MSNNNFENTLNDLQLIVSKLEKNDLDLNDAIQEFEKGIKLTKVAELQLQEIKDKVTKIVNENKIEDFSLNE